MRGFLGGFAGGSQSFRGARMRRGDVRTAVLDVLAEKPMNGYQVIQRIAERSGGAWKPSPGSVYPTLQQLEDEGLVRPAEAAGRKVFELTEDGRAYVEDNADELAETWRVFADAEEDDSHDLRRVVGQLMAACWQIAVSGSPRQQERALEVLAEARRKLHGLLAEGDDE